MATLTNHSGSYSVTHILLSIAQENTQPLVEADGKEEARNQGEEAKGRAGF